MVSGARAQAIVQQLEAAVNAEKRVFIGFRIGDFVPELFVYQNAVRKGETGVVNKGRLSQVTFAKVDGQTFDPAFAPTLHLENSAGIVIISDELVRFSKPSAEAVVRQELLAASALFHDPQLLDPTIAENPIISPASITFGAASYSSTGTDAASIDADLKNLLAALVAADCTERDSTTSYSRRRPRFRSRKKQ